jgi:hypothetical protein
VIEIIINFAKAGRCRFFQWIDGPEMFDPQILFSYDDNQSFLYRSLQCWVAPPPNPPPMADEEKEEAMTHRVNHPPLCKYGYRSQLVNPSTSLDYTPF